MDLPLRSIGCWDEIYVPGAIKWPRERRGRSITDDVDLGVDKDLVAYLTHAPVESWELASSWCRLCGLTQRMGCATRSDGVYMWPDGLVHYVADHAIELPAAFLRHVEATLASLRSAGHPAPPDARNWRLPRAGAGAAAMTAAEVTHISAHEPTTIARLSATAAPPHPIHEDLVLWLKAAADVAGAAACDNEGAPR